MLLHLLDGTYELFRAYFGRPPRSAPDGRPVGAVHGLLESTLGLLREPNVTHLGVATDTVIESFRNDLFDGYKSGEGIEPEILAQFALAEQALEAIGVRVWRMREFEADDALATAAARWVEDVDQVVIASPDKDMAQCVTTDRVVMLDRRREIVLDEEGVIEKFGVRPASIPDYLALVGDTADGIPGIPAWGAKSASQVLFEYDHVAAIPDDETEWTIKVRGAARLAANLRERRQEVELYRTLATLRVDAPLPDDLDDLRWEGADRDAFEGLCDELGFTSLRTRPHRWRGE